MEIDAGALRLMWHAMSTRAIYWHAVCVRKEPMGHVCRKEPVLHSQLEGKLARGRYLQAVWCVI